MATKSKAKPAKKIAKVVKKVKKTAVVKKPVVAQLAVPKKAFTQTQLIQVLSEHAGIGRKEVKALWETLHQIVQLHLGKKGPGQFTFPGIAKIVAASKPATKARKGRNPATGETITIKAKPARRVLKARILKKFKNEVL